ncbi:hypothetical protein OVY01_10160 [Robbsia sp. Bb-Pol-6]|uniref:Uncharacterized protein n=1 Tax=Robbsia betulipollinis TaxID=2981849 RepID=A0ABT3ZM35_9BURK|nr:hypothetical protein [Robbsia betulipollinis]MCY0387589.1 hypothetical protein [Robbsia betulipollinis]
MTTLIISFIVFLNLAVVAWRMWATRPRLAPATRGAGALDAAGREAHHPARRATL